MQKKNIIKRKRKLVCTHIYKYNMCVPVKLSHVEKHLKTEIHARKIRETETERERKKERVREIEEHGRTGGREDDAVPREGETAGQGGWGGEGNGSA